MFKKHKTLESPSLATKKRWKFRLKVALFILVPIGAITGLSQLSFADVVQIKDINVEGVSEIDPMAVEARISPFLVERYALVFSRATLLTYPRTAVIDAVKAFGLKVKTVDVSISGLHTLSIKITERKPVALWCQTIEQNIECFILDDTGLAYDQGVATSTVIIFQSASSSPRIMLGTHIASETSFKAFMKFVSSISDIGFRPVRADLSAQGDLSLVMASSSPRIVVAFGQDMKKTFERFRALTLDPAFRVKISNKSIEYIDTRFGSKVYYKATSTLPRAR